MVAGAIRPVTAVGDCRMVGLWHTTREPMRGFVQRMLRVGGKCNPSSGDPVDVRVVVRAVKDEHRQTALAAEVIYVSRPGALTLDFGAIATGCVRWTTGRAWPTRS